MKGMWKCAKKGDTQEFTRLLNKGESLLDVDSVSRTPMHYAAEFGSIEIAKLIINKGGTASVELRDQKGETPLEIAIQNGHEEFALLLVTSGGASVDALFDKDRRIAVPKRLEFKLKEIDLKWKKELSSNSSQALNKSRPLFVDKSPPLFDEPMFTSPSDANTSTPTEDFTNLSGTQPYPSSGASRATPAPPSFGRSFTATPAPVTEAFQPPQLRKELPGKIPQGSLPVSAPEPVRAPSTMGAGIVDLAMVINSAVRVIHASLHEQFTQAQQKELNEATKQFAWLVVAPVDSLRVVSQNLREVGQFPVLGPMDVKRSKRVKEDYAAIFDRIRPIQDALRVLELDRRAHAPTLVHPPLLYLVGGVFSMTISVEQPYTSHLDQAVSGISRAIRELSSPPTSIQLGHLTTSFIHFLRCLTVRVLEIRCPATCCEVVHLVLSISKATRSIFSSDPSLCNSQLKLIVENLKNVMVVIKSNLPSRVGRELSPAEDSALYAEAVTLLQQTFEMVCKKSTPGNCEVLLKRIAGQLPKLQSGFREIHATASNKVKGGLGGLGRGVLGDAQQLSADISEVAQLCASRLTLPTNQIEDEWKDAKLGALETMTLSGLLLELVVACIAVRNRLPHHSHVPLLLVLFTTAAQFALPSFVSV